ncbi:M23 family metallopeptidase [Candidatus Parcubacteria bacterium]|nr:M23 family metallopeptidase [Candidatus Parcubacteria bacterium]
MKRGLLIVTITAIVVALAVGHKPATAPENTAPNVPDTEIQEVKISILPETILQGDPAEVVVENIGTSTIKSLTFQGKPLGVFTYNDKPTALIGIDLKMPVGVYPLFLSLSDGRTLRKNLIISKRQIVTAPLGIPESLGGNTPEAANNLIATLAEENAIINSVPSENALLWSGPFRFPLEKVEITDVYGYTRSTVNTTISHKGTDFRAAVGTPVYAMNSGKARLVREFRNYGKTIIIDHGFGLQTIYMHLSEVSIEEGQNVSKGQSIGKSGQTGYAEFPHLHISVKISGISIDPMKFMALFVSI